MGGAAAGEGLETRRHSAALSLGKVGVLHGSRSLVLQENEGQLAPPHSVAPGLDYPGVGPEHCHLKAIGRAEYFAVGEQEAIEALRILAREEGILCALESAHAVAGGLRLARERPGSRIVIGGAGRGDKDMPELAKLRVTEA